MPSDTLISFEDSLARLATIETDDFHGVKDLRVLWAAMIDEDSALLAHMYGFYLDTVRTLLDAVPSRNAPERLDAYRFVIAFSSSAHLNARNARADALRLLVAHHQEHLALIEQALTRPDDRITDKHSRLQTGKWGDIPGAMLELYSWHTSYDADSRRIQAEAARLIPAFCRAFPDQDNFILAQLLMSHPEAVAETASLIRFHLLERGKLDEGIVPSLATDMLGHYADKDDVAHKNSPLILSGALKDCAGWPADRIEKFVEYLIRHPLGIETLTQDEAVARQRGTVENYKRIIAEDRYKSYMGISAQSKKERDQQSLKAAEAELALIQSDLDGWNARRRRKAVQRIAVSAATRKALQSVAKALPAAYRQPVRDLLDEAAAYASRPKRFPMPKPADNRFKDFGLKLLVIEELMYRQKALEPRFDIREFAREYEKREISVESDGYAVIPEAERYFRNLGISGDLLARVEVLHQSSGLDGGSEFINHLFPFWDPGVGDEPVAVTAKAVADLELLPNLKRISGLENSKPGSKLLKTLAERGVELVTEEEA